MSNSRKLLWRGIVVLTMAGLGWVDYATGRELSLFAFYAIPVLIAIWTTGVPFGVATAVCCELIWVLVNENVHPFRTPWGYPSAAIGRAVYFGFVVVAGAAVRNRQLLDFAAIERLAKLKAKEVDINAVYEHELHLVGRTIEHVLGDRMQEVLDGLGGLRIREAKDQGEGGLALKTEQSLIRVSMELRAITDCILPSAGNIQGNHLLSSLESLVKSKTATSCPQMEIAADSANVTIDNPEVCMHLYRIAHEALDNAIRHSQAGHIWISLHGFYDHVELRVDDDGRGMPELPEPKLGLWMGVKTMRFRADSLGGYFSIQGRPGGGTSVACRVPYLDSMKGVV